jgi:hypothetical protein
VSSPLRRSAGNHPSCSTAAVCATTDQRSEKAQPDAESGRDHGGDDLGEHAQAAQRHLSEPGPLSLADLRHGMDVKGRDQRLHERVLEQEQHDPGARAAVCLRRQRAVAGRRQHGQLIRRDHAECKRQEQQREALVDVERLPDDVSDRARSLELRRR